MQAAVGIGKEVAGKLPQITALFWALKMAGTTLGETGGDYISEGLHVGFLMTFFLVMAAFLVLVNAQVKLGRLVPSLYWTVIVMTSMAGTEMADFIFHTLGIGFVSIVMGLIAPMVVVFLLGRFTGGSFSVTDIKSRRDEVLYWSLILTSNTIGTGIGDGLGASPIGKLGSTLLIAAIMLGLYWTYRYTNASRVGLFWATFVLTRPLGATGGDLLWQPHSMGGLGLGRVTVSLALIAFMAVLVHRQTRQLAEAERSI